MEFEKLFEGGSWPEVRERIGVMSVESLNRQWIPVIEEKGYLVAKSKDGQAALLGRMCKREDGKFCIEVVVRAEMRNEQFFYPEFWYIGMGNAQQLYDAMQRHISKPRADREQ